MKFDSINGTGLDRCMPGPVKDRLVLRRSRNGKLRIVRVIYNKRIRRSRTMTKLMSGRLLQMGVGGWK